MPKNEPRDQKRKHVTLTLRTKAEIVEKINNGVKLATLARFYGIGRATIQDIKKNRQKILDYVSSAECRPGRQTMKSGEYPQVENALYKWFAEERTKNTMITGDIIREKAKFFYTQINGKDDFKASDGWLDKFKKRYGIRLLNNTKQLQSPYSREIQEKFLRKIQEMNLLPEQVYAASESLLLWKLLPYKKYRNMSKDRMLFIQCSNSTATQKLKLLIIGNSTLIEPQNTFPALYKTQYSPCFTHEVLHEWFHEHFIPSVSEFLSSQNLPCKALLILSNTPNFTNETEITSPDGSMQIMFVPNDYAPTDNNIKYYYKKDLMYKAINDNEGIDKFLREYNLMDAVFSLTFFWEKISPQKIILSWKNIWPTHPLSEEESSQTNGSGDFLADNEFIEMVLNKCIQDETITNDGIRDWLSENYDANVSTADELINNVKTEDTEIKDVPVGWTFDPINLVSNEEAISAINTCIKWGEENNIEENDLAALNRIREKMFANTFNVKVEEPNLDCYNSIGE